MRTALISMGILAIGLVMLVGTATAGDDENMEITPSSAPIPYDPNYVSYSVYIYEIYNTTATHEINATVIGGDPGWSADHLRFRFTNETGADSGWITSGTNWNWGTPQTGDDENLTMDVMAVSGAPQGCNYTIEVTDVGGEICVGTETAWGTVWGTSIPEFATIAIPVVAVLGLFLFYSHRKRKEE